jgi:hypothetical protein
MQKTTIKPKKQDAQQPEKVKAESKVLNTRKRKRRFKNQ